MVQNGYVSINNKENVLIEADKREEIFESHGPIVCNFPICTVSLWFRIIN